MTLSPQVTTPATGILPAEARVRLLSTDPGYTYSAPLWSLYGDQRLLDALLSSGIEWTWESSIDLGLPKDDPRQQRGWTQLSDATAHDLRNDMTQFNADEKGRRFTLCGNVSNSNPIKTESALTEFLKNGNGLEVVIHQCSDSDEYIFVAANPTNATLRFLGTLFTPTRAEKISEPSWLKHTRTTGTLPL
ncbi:hypothetical protein ACFQBQ_05265 [Granulicella cerasi]|uniref:DUF4253 domain-containing protein n=1 Tax=Granulicella cerasi TaxID=741063 RepID=A0ABW1Z626_9BACT|nr:hypothetical protein [Granulicella cerasi]